jgi:hypothetical protein
LSVSILARDSDSSRHAPVTDLILSSNWHHGSLAVTVTVTTVTVTV